MNYNWDWGVFFKSTGVGSETYLDWYISGLGWTIAIAVVAWIIALLLGSILGVMRTVPNRLVSGIATCYVELFRNVPLLVQLFIWYFLVPDLLPQPAGLVQTGLNPTTSAYLSVVVCLGLFTAARVSASKCAPVSRRCRAARIRRPRHGFQAAADLLERAAAPGLPHHHSAADLGIPQRVQELLRGVLDRPDGTAGATKQTAEFSANLFEAFTLATLIYFTLNMSLMLLMRGREESRGAWPDLRGGK
jgi:glutamate/aspartate transport system permease protein